MFGVYIHYPWCRSRCPYCDFAIAVRAPGEASDDAAYLDALIRELDRRAPQLADRKLTTIYIGGGTPSFADSQLIAGAISAVRRSWSGRPREVTLEANPTDCTAANMDAWLEAGVTRLSVGVQSTRQDELTWLGRDHRMGDGIAGLSSALSAGFASVTADVILGVPVGDPVESVDSVIAAGAPHISVYELTIEERTPLGRRVARGELSPRGADELADLYTATRERLVAAGYEHYEVSSYAREGHRAVHNSAYWRLGEFLGVGNGAASFVAHPDGGGERWTNPRSVGRYLAGGEPEIETLTADDLAGDRIWLGMRTADGVDRSAFAGRDELLSELLADGLAIADGDRIRPTLRGFLLNDFVARRAVVR